MALNMNFSGTTKRLFNLDDKKFEDIVDMNSYPSILTPPSDSPERSNAFSPPLNARENVYAHHQETPMQCENDVPNTPCLKILEQPIEKFRFRYKSEMAGTHGSITGRTADRNRRQTFPTVQLCNYSGPAVLRCSVYQEAPQSHKECQPHAHRLVKKVAQNEIDDPHDVPVSGEEDYTVGFYGLGIIHTARKQIVEVMTRKKLFLKCEEIARKEKKKRDITAEEFLEVKNEVDSMVKEGINLNIVRLRFDAFRVQDGIYDPICSPVYSKKINNLKSAQTCDLKIVRMDHCTSPCKGNKEIFILVEKVTKKNIKIRFFELNEEEETVWEDFGSFNDLDVHHQFAIVFKTPPYRDINCDRHVKVFMELVRPSDNARSEPKEFTYTPCDPITGRKRPRTSYGSGSSYSSYNSSYEIPLTVNQANVVRSEELEEALRQGNISSSEVERMFNAFGPQYKMIDFANLDDEITNVDGGRFLVMDAGSGSRRELSNDNFDSRVLNSDEKKIVMRVYGELNSFLKTKPDTLRKQQMAQHIFNTFSSSSGDSPFHLALYGQSNKLLLLLVHLLSENPPPSVINARNQTRDSVMHIAVAMGVVPIVGFLVNRNADLTLQNDEGNTALHLAVKKFTDPSTKKQSSGHILNSLLVNQNNVKKFIDLENNAGDTALMIAVESRNLDAVKKLCSKGANINHKHKKNGFTSLHMAVYTQCYEIVDYLLECKDIELQMFDFKDCTPYKLAVNLKDETIISQKICERIEDYMRLNGISEIVEVKEETSNDLSDDEEIKLEPMSPATTFEEEYTSFPFNSDCLDEVAKYLDESGNWKNLAELLDMEHFVRIEDIKNFKSPSKSLLNMAQANGESVARIRDFLENLDEKEAVRIIDKMCIRNREHSNL